MRAHGSALDAARRLRRGDGEGHRRPRFPTLATPLLSLAVDVKTAVVLLILPNIVMDGIQFARARRADGDDPPARCRC